MRGMLVGAGYCSEVGEGDMSVVLIVEVEFGLAREGMSRYHLALESRGLGYRFASLVVRHAGSSATPLPLPSLV